MILPFPHTQAPKHWRCKVQLVEGLPVCRKSEVPLPAPHKPGDTSPLSHHSGNGYRTVSSKSSSGYRVSLGQPEIEERKIKSKNTSWAGDVT